MKTQLSLLAVGAFIGTVALASQPARAVQGPWCAVQSAGPDTVIEDCQYHSFEQCRLQVVSGNRGTCTQNPRWPGRWEQRAQHRTRR